MTELYAWGSAAHGKTGHDSATGRMLYPVKNRTIAALGRRPKLIEAGAEHCAAVMEDGVLFMWGEGRHGKLGVGDERQRIVPTEVKAFTGVARVRQVACGSHHTIVVTEGGAVYAFGLFGHGMLGIGRRKRTLSKFIGMMTGTQFYVPVPTRVQGLDRVKIVQAACGKYHTVLLSDLGSVFTCGDGKKTPLGHSQQQAEKVPRQVMMLTERILQVAAGKRFSLALSESNRVYSWGREGPYLGLRNVQGDLASPSIVMALEGKGVLGIAAGWEHCLAVTDDRVYAWGVGRGGRLGLGHQWLRKNRNEPCEVPKLTGKGIVTVRAGYAHSAAIGTNGTLFVWGRSRHGEVYAKGTISEPKGFVFRDGKAARACALGKEFTLALWNTPPVSEADRQAHTSAQAAYTAAHAQPFHAAPQSVQHALPGHRVAQPPVLMPFDMGLSSKARARVEAKAAAKAAAIENAYVAEQRAGAAQGEAVDVGAPAASASHSGLYPELGSWAVDRDLSIDIGSASSSALYDDSLVLEAVHSTPGSAQSLAEANYWDVVESDEASLYPTLDGTTFYVPVMQSEEAVEITSGPHAAAAAAPPPLEDDDVVSEASSEADDVDSEAESVTTEPEQLLPPLDALSIVRDSVAEMDAAEEEAEEVAAAEEEEEEAPPAVEEEEAPAAPVAAEVVEEEPTAPVAAEEVEEPAVHVEEEEEEEESPAEVEAPAAELEAPATAPLDLPSVPLEMPQSEPIVLPSVPTHLPVAEYSREEVYEGPM